MARNIQTSTLQGKLEPCFFQAGDQGEAKGCGRGENAALLTPGVLQFLPVPCQENASFDCNPRRHVVQCVVASLQPPHAGHM
jgi:hypothetical protein